MNDTNQPQTIVVPPEGLALTAVLHALGLTFDAVNPLLGQELGSPRDYSMPAGARCLVFTGAGVQRLASLFGLVVNVIDAVPPAVDVGPASAPSPAETQPTTDAHGRPRGPWWKQRDLE